MKKFSAILLSILICITFFGCSANDNTASLPETTIVAGESQAGSKAGSTTVAATDAKSSQGSVQSSEGKSTIKANTTAGAKATTVSGKANTAQTTQGSGKGGGSPGSTKANQTAKKSTAAKTTKKSTVATTKKSTASSTVTCKVTIECTSILSHMDNLKHGHESYVPSDGYMIRNHSVTLKNGASAYDIVKAACDDTGVKMTAKGSQYGIYVVGFNNIDEKDCGAQSGWMYKVNGKYPPVSCGSYTVKNGDNIVFTYTCSNN